MDTEEAGVNTAGWPEQTACEGTGKVIDGLSSIVTVVVVSNPGQGGDGAIIYVTVYVPGVLCIGEIAPVVLSILSPAPELKLPPCVPVNVTATFGSDEHIGG